MVTLHHLLWKVLLTAEFLPSLLYLLTLALFSTKVNPDISMGLFYVLYLPVCLSSCLYYPAQVCLYAALPVGNMTFVLTAFVLIGLYCKRQLFNGTILIYILMYHSGQYCNGEFHFWLWSRWSLFLFN
jgi:hypothetical protein